jgi:hypothetical protein
MRFELNYGAALRRCPVQLRISWLIPISALLLAAAMPAWRTKPIAQWTEEDANQVLTDSPWAMKITAGVTRRQSEDERREGGDMGQPHGIGYDGLDAKGGGQKAPSSIADLVTPDHGSTRSLPGITTLGLRWESALPIRAAELKVHFVEPPTLDTEGYQIAVYGVPGNYFKGDPKSLGEPLKKDAVLKREGKKDVKPSSAEVFQRENGPVVVYVFPLSAEISNKDGRIVFEAQIGRIVISQPFDVAAMQFQGKLEI